MFLTLTFCFGKIVSDVNHSANTLIGPTAGDNRASTTSSERESGREHAIPNTHQSESNKDFVDIWTELKKSTGNCFGLIISRLSLFEDDFSGLSVPTCPVVRSKEPFMKIVSGSVEILDVVLKVGDQPCQDLTLEEARSLFVTDEDTLRVHLRRYARFSTQERSKQETDSNKVQGKKLGNAKRKNSVQGGTTPKKRHVLDLEDTPEGKDRDKSSQKCQGKGRVTSCHASSMNLEEGLFDVESDSDEDEIIFPPRGQNSSVSKWNHVCSCVPEISDKNILYFVESMVNADQAEANEFAAEHVNTFSAQVEEVVNLVQFDNRGMRENYLIQENCEKCSISKMQLRVRKIRKSFKGRAGKRKMERWTRAFKDFFPNYALFDQEERVFETQTLGPHIVFRCNMVRNHNILIASHIFKDAFSPLKCQFAELKLHIGVYDDWFYCLHYALKKNWADYLQLLERFAKEIFPPLGTHRGMTFELTLESLKECFAMAWVSERWDEVMESMQEAFDIANNQREKPKNLPLIRYLEQKKTDNARGSLDDADFKKLVAVALSRSSRMVTEFFSLEPDRRFKSFCLEKLHLRTLIVDKLDQTHQEAVRNPYSFLPETLEQDERFDRYEPVGYIFLTCEQGNGFNLLGRPHGLRIGQDTMNQFIFSVPFACANNVTAFLWEHVVNADYDSWRRIEDRIDEQRTEYDFPGWEEISNMEPSRETYLRMNFLDPCHVDRLVQELDGGDRRLEGRDNISLAAAMIVCRIRVNWLQDEGRIAKKALRKIANFVHPDKVRAWVGNDQVLLNKTQQQMRQINSCKSFVLDWIRTTYANEDEATEDDVTIRDIVKDVYSQLARANRVRNRLMF